MAIPEDVSAALAVELRKRRDNARLTQPEAAAASHLRQPTIVRRIEKNERQCSVPQLVGLATTYRTRASEILASAEAAAAGREPDQQPCTEHTTQPPHDVSRALAKELRERREAAGLSQPALAHRSGLKHATTIARLEHHERRCNIPQLVRLGEALGLPASRLLAAAEARAEREAPPEISGLPAALQGDL